MASAPPDGCIGGAVPGNGAARSRPGRGSGRVAPVYMTGCVGVGVMVGAGVGVAVSG